MVNVLPLPVTPSSVWILLAALDALDQSLNRRGLIARRLERRHHLEIWHTLDLRFPGRNGHDTSLDKNNPRSGMRRCTGLPHSIPPLPRPRVDSAWNDAATLSPNA